MERLEKQSRGTCKNQESTGSQLTFWVVLELRVEEFEHRPLLSVEGGMETRSQAALISRIHSADLGDLEFAQILLPPPPIY